MILNTKTIIYVYSDLTSLFCISLVPEKNAVRYD